MFIVAPQKVTGHSYHTKFCDFRFQSLVILFTRNEISGGANDIWQHLVIPICWDMWQKLVWFTVSADPEIYIYEESGWQVVFHICCYICCLPVLRYADENSQYCLYGWAVITSHSYTFTIWFYWYNKITISTNKENWLSVTFEVKVIGHKIIWNM